MAILFFSRAFFFCLFKTFYYKNDIEDWILNTLPISNTDFYSFKSLNQTSQFFEGNVFKNKTIVKFTSCFLQLYLNQICLITIPQTICSIACVFFCSRAKLYIPSTLNIWKKELNKAIWADKKWAAFWQISLYIK